MKRLLATTACVCTCTISSITWAHAFLDRAQPPVGSTLHAPPQTVRLSFTEPLEPAFSRVRVEDAGGRNVDLNDSHVDVKNASVLTVALPPLAPGAYRVRWRVVSVDTHVTEGDYTFTIAR